MASIIDDEKRWLRIWNDCGATPSDGLRERLIVRYQEASRAYHTVEHLTECFHVLDEVTDTPPADVELALWFHDAVYDTQASDNEQQSADWARQALLDGGAPQPRADRVHRLIMATRHDAVPEDEMTKLLVDVDLSILGAEPLRFDEYERQIRQEYAWVPEDAFRTVRAQILRSFLDRPSIYATSWFIPTWEARARKNLERSLSMFV